MARRAQHKQHKLARFYTCEHCDLVDDGTSVKDRSDGYYTTNPRYLCDQCYDKLADAYMQRQVTSL